MVRIVDCEPLHIKQLLAKPLRQSDVNEWVLLSGMTVEDNLRLNTNLKDVRACLNAHGECIALWGLNGVFGWLIATKEAERHGRAIHRSWKKELRDFALKLGPGVPLYAICLHTNKAMVHWHQMLGFEVDRAERINGLPVIVYRRDFSWVS